MLDSNPLRVLPKRYSTTATGLKDVERDRRLQEGEESRIPVSYTHLDVYKRQSST